MERVLLVQLYSERHRNANVSKEVVDQKVASVVHTHLFVVDSSVHFTAPSHIDH
jgi:hypothetical protein